MNNDRARVLLKTLKEYYTKIMPNVIPLQREDEKGKNELIQALDIAIESLDNEWVYVRDRLPQDNETVLCYGIMADGYGGETMKFKIGTHKKEMDKKTGRKFFITKYYSVIAWRPLPQPYERKE